MLLVVNYHYIGPEDSYPYPGIYSTPIDRLAGQLDALGRCFEFVGEADLLAAVAGGRPLPEQACLITFDDGLRAQYELVLPLLDRRRIPALFFVNGLPLAEERLLLTHMLHYCRANFPPEEFMARFRVGYRREIGREFDPGDFAVPDTRNREFHRYDDPEIARFKYIVNRFIAHDLQERIFRVIFRELVSDERQFVRDLYLGAEEVRDLGRRGSLGTHTFGHRSLSALPDAEVDREIGLGTAILSRISGIAIRSVSYPYGSAEDFSAGLVRVVRSHGLVLGFTMERSVNQTLAEPLLLARFDTNDVPGGKRPGVVLDPGGVRVTNPAFTDHRTLYFDERTQALTLRP